MYQITETITEIPRDDEGEDSVGNYTWFRLLINRLEKIPTGKEDKSIVWMRKHDAIAKILEEKENQLGETVLLEDAQWKIILEVGEKGWPKNPCIMKFLDYSSRLHLHKRKRQARNYVYSATRGTSHYYYYNDEQRMTHS